MVRTVKAGGIALAAVGAFMTVSASAIDPSLYVNSGRFALGIVGYVPVICRANVDATRVATTPGAVPLGQLSEFCNSPNGYEVYADHSADLAKGSLVIGGQKVPLSNAGSTRIRKSNRAAIDSADIALEVPKGVTTGQISFRIVPL